MSTVQYYLLDGTQLGSLLDSLKSYTVPYVTVSRVDGIRSGGHSALNREGRFLVRLTSDQFMFLYVSDAYDGWLSASRRRWVFTDSSPVRVMTKYATVDGSFTYEAQTDG